MKGKTFQHTKDNFVQSQKLIALYSDIGRGHPSYLDSLVYLLKNRYPHPMDPNSDLVCRTVFQESKGISLFSWRFLSRLYRISGKGGLQTKFYNLIRRRSPKDSLVIKILGRDIKRAYKNFSGICLADHPIIAQALKDVCRVWYAHGEITAPRECAVRGVERILVPLDETKEKLITLGAEKESILICGLMIETQLVTTAELSYQKRLERIRSNQPLTVGFFTSGAYPKEHMEKIILGVKSVIEKKMKAIIFCGTDYHKFEWVKNKIFLFWQGFNPSRQAFRASPRPICVEDKGETQYENKEFDLMLVTRKTRQEDTQRSTELFPRLDVFVSASHERTNWAVGLGLPMFVLFPLIGTFASQNFEFAQKQKVVYPLDSTEKAANLGQILSDLKKSDQLFQMTQNGFGVHRINGIDTAVSHFAKDSGKI